MKKRGLGKGFWNGAGGKVEDGETLGGAVIRETNEEIGVDVDHIVKVALLHFYFPDDPQKLGWNQDVHAFFAKKWKGKPKETEEMRPRWFKKSEVPYDKMWDGDNVWIPRVLKGDKIEAWFEFDDNSKMIDYKVRKLFL